LRAIEHVPAGFVTVAEVRVGLRTSAVEECVDGVERLVVLELEDRGWVVTHVLGADAEWTWC
jgi:hypothetical protein